LQDEWKKMTGYLGNTCPAGRSKHRSHVRKLAEQIEDDGMMQSYSTIVSPGVFVLGRSSGKDCMSDAADIDGGLV